jgi:hypothetical protein
MKSSRRSRAGPPFPVHRRCCACRRHICALAADDQRRPVDRTFAGRRPDVDDVPASIRPLMHTWQSAAASLTAEYGTPSVLIAASTKPTLTIHPPPRTNALLALLPLRRPHCNSGLGRCAASDSSSATPRPLTAASAITSSDGCGRRCTRANGVYELSPSSGFAVPATFEPDQLMSARACVHVSKPTLVQSASAEVPSDGLAAVKNRP